MSWVEDTVTFRGAIRRSGNSLVITIPAELSQRFLLKEGQELLIYGISRRGPEFEGGLQIYLGYFVVHEKLPSARFKVEADDLAKLQMIIKEIEREYLPSRVLRKKIGDRIVELQFMFGAITEKGIKRVRSMEEVEEIASTIEFKLSSEGFKVLERSVEEKIVEWRNMDPALISRAAYRLAKVVRWSWEI